MGLRSFAGSHKNSVKSSDPETSRSTPPAAARASLYLFSAASCLFSASLIEY